MGKVHDQIKAVLGAWGEWTTHCPCDCEYCVELDRKLADLTNAWGLINSSKRSSIKVSKRQRPSVIIREVRKAWVDWIGNCLCCLQKNIDIVYPECFKLKKGLEALNQLIEAGPEEEKKENDNI